jgi:hypothetical protein
MGRIITVIITFMLLVSLAFILFSCGPSLRRTFQSDNAFARCFDMDYNPAASAEEKNSCWTTWLERRVYNQPVDKIEYARLRLEELAAGISIPGPPGPPGSFYVRPQITLMDAGVGAADSDGGTKHRATREYYECVRSCLVSEKACQNACNHDGGVSSPGCLRACRAGNEACTKGCN